MSLQTTPSSTNDTATTTTTKASERSDDSPPPLKAYFQLLVDDHGRTSMIRRDFTNTERQGYAHTPQTIKELSDAFGSHVKVIFTALEGENPCHFFVRHRRLWCACRVDGTFAPTTVR
jgi:hypothetical protein